MNKQELIRKYEELWKEHSPFHEPVPYTSMVELFLKELKQLDEPQKVTIPKFVADWIEEARETTYNIRGAIEMAPNGKVKDWLELKNVNIFAEAWVNGYEVEKEKRYTVKLKGLEREKCYLNFNFGGVWLFYTNENFFGYRSHHTRKELEEAGFGEVFNSPLFEVVEVE